LSNKNVDLQVILDLGKRGLTQNQIAKSLGVTQAAVSLKLSRHKKKIAGQAQLQAEQQKALEILEKNNEFANITIKKTATKITSILDQFTIDSIQEKVTIDGKQLVIVRKKPENGSVNKTEQMLDQIVQLYDEFLENVLIPLQKTNPELFAKITDYLREYGDIRKKDSA
jgi:predicted transcriptional regulator